MLEGQFSHTALMISAYRARAAERYPELCGDRWAKSLAGDEGFAFAARWDRVFPPMELWVAVRTAFFDRLVTGVGNRLGQVVLLGAGLDTRSSRLKGPVFYEVDHPDTQRLKLERLAALDGYPQDSAHYVSCDFGRQSWLEELTRAGFDRDKPALFVVEGVTPYLEEVAVRSTLGMVTECAPGSVVAFDYYLKRLIDRDPTSHPDTAAVRSLVDDVGEPLRWGTNNPLPMLAELGFRAVFSHTFEELALNLHGSYVRERAFHLQRVAVASTASAGFTAW